MKRILFGVSFLGVFLFGVYVFLPDLEAAFFGNPSQGEIVNASPVLRRGTASWRAEIRISAPTERVAEAVPLGLAIEIGSVHGVYCGSLGKCYIPNHGSWLPLLINVVGLALFGVFGIMSVLPVPSNSFVNWKGRIVGTFCCGVIVLLGLSGFNELRQNNLIRAGMNFALAFAFIIFAAAAVIMLTYEANRDRTKLRQ